jgi:hypothetical protein
VKRTLLFTGHRVDAPGRAEPRFPPAQVEAAARAIAHVLDTLGASAPDTALTQGAAGGDLLFSEQCVARGIAVDWLQPLAEEEFIRQSVASSSDGACWRRRYAALRASPLVALHTLPPPADGVQIWAAGNQRLLQEAQARGAAHVIALWDGRPGDGAGGTADLVAAARAAGVPLTWIDASRL